MNFGGISMPPAKPEQIDRMLALVADAEKSKRYLEALKAATVEYRAAEAKAVKEQRVLEAKRKEDEEAIARERKDLETREAALAAEEARRRLAVDALEKAAAEKDARSEALLAQRTRDADAAAKLRQQLQAAVDKIAA
jgi:hypothetical protein